MLSLNKVSFAYAEKNVINNISFSVKKGEHIAIMGESGCGKSTLLKAIYGLLDLPKGEISYNEKKLLGPEFHLVPGHPFMKYLAQEFNLMPFTSAAENVGDFLSNFYPKKKKLRVIELLEVVGMTEFADIHVRYLSGGQKQRIALARVLAKEPEILLLDEPFSQIDNFKKNELRYRLFEYLKQQQITCITATHDKNDVMPFADKMCILKKGKKLITDSPKNIYSNPKLPYIASLFSEINVLNAQLFYKDLNKKKVIIYPNEIKVSLKNILKAEVINTYFKGNHYLIEAKIKRTKLLFTHTKSLKPGVFIGIKVSKKLIQQRMN